MTFTLTGNLLAERTFEFTNWVPGRTQRAIRQSFQVGGKGINVAKMLHRLAEPVTALCFAGGAAGEECAAWLGSQPWSTEVFRSVTPTRTGVVVRAPDQAETTFLGPDAPPDSAALGSCAKYLSALDGRGEVLAFCGSFPGWGDPATETLRRSVANWARRGILVADSHGPSLTWLVGQPIRLVKINRQEFDGLLPPAVGAETDGLGARLIRAQALWPGPVWIITDGPRPVWFAGPDMAPGCLTPPTVREISSTGSGDVFFACLLHALFGGGQSLADAVGFALTRAAANAASRTIAEFDLSALPAGPNAAGADTL